VNIKTTTDGEIYGGMIPGLAVPHICKNLKGQPRSVSKPCPENKKCTCDINRLVITGCRCGGK
jgi:hypothetical protein